MSTRFAVLITGLAAMLVLAPADASARGGSWHGGGGFHGGGFHGGGFRGGGFRGGFGVFVGPPRPFFRPFGFGYGWPYYGYAAPYGYAPPAYWPPPVVYGPPPYYVPPPPVAYYGAPTSGYLPPSGAVDGGYKR